MKKKVFIANYAIREEEVLSYIKNNHNMDDITIITRQPRENDPDIILSGITILTETRDDEDPDILG